MRFLESFFGYITAFRGDLLKRCKVSGVTNSACALRGFGVTWMSESKGEKRQKLSTLDSRLSTLHFGKIMDSKIIF